MKRTILMLMVIAILSMSISPAFADGGDDIWDGVILEDGSLDYDNLIDQGVYTETVDWMPDTPFGPMQAEYHLWSTPDGTVVQMPSATTLFFMAFNPEASGLSDTSSSHTSTLGDIIAMPGLISAVLQGAEIDFSDTEYVDADQYADALLAGDADIWSLGAGDLLGILRELANNSIKDKNLYTAILLYTSDNIPEDILEEFPELIDFLTTTPDGEFVPPPSCPEPRIEQGAISKSGRLVAPNFPLVVGQDPEKRGVDVDFSVSVAPTIYTHHDLVPVIGEECNALKGTSESLSDCTRPNGLPGVMLEGIVDWVCEEHTEVYPETIPVAYGSLALSQESKNWILDVLSIRYPGAYVHNASFRYPSSSGGSTSSFSQTGVQVADPGSWSINIGGRTSGTPVSDSRNFRGEAGSFDVYLKETAIIN